jgi:F0F1-type ATP synthase delta subunit
MLPEKIGLKIIELAKTREDLLELEVDINQVEAKLYSSSFKLENLAGEVSAGFLKLLSDLDKDSLLPNQVDEREKLFKDLKEFLQNFDRVGLTLAFSPSKDFLSKLSHWFGSSLEKPLVLDILVNPEIAGGLILEHAGNYRDYSISENLNKTLADKTFVNSLLDK